MIYTCYEMIRDCRAGRPEGWSYFLTQYVPVIRGFLMHYFPERAGDRRMIERVLVTLRQPESGLFESLDPAPERAFVAGLRQQVVAAVEADRASAAPEVSIDIEALGAALEPLTLTEKLVIWFETMRYGGRDTGRMLRMSPETAEKIRARAAELIRAGMDSWRSTVLADNGPLLGQAASALSTKDCLPAEDVLRRDRWPRYLARPRGNGAPCERLLALPGSLLPLAGSGGCAARLEAAARIRSGKL